MIVGIKVDISDNSEDVKKMSEEAIGRALEKIGMMAESYAKMNAPVDTGRLRNSIAHEVDGSTVYIGSNVEYAETQEIGSSKVAGKFYLTRAVRDHVEEYQAIVEEEFRNS
jgi:phage gpG-like protein